MRTYKSKSQSRKVVAKVEETIPAHSESLPHCHISTSVHIYELNPCLSRSIQLHPSMPQRLTLHQYQQFKSSDFDFDQLTHQHSSGLPFDDIDLFQSLIEYERDLCVLAVGGPTAGVAITCEGEGLRDFWDRLLASAAVGSQESVSLSHFQLHISFLAVYNDRVHDLLKIRSQPKIQQRNERMTVHGCESIQVSSMVSIGLAIQQALEQRRLVYPSSIFVIQGKVTFTLKMNPSDQKTRNFDLMVWEKDLNSKQQVGSSHNSQSLLHLNICLHQLYKIRCHHPSHITQVQCNRLWAKFRNSAICKLLKNYFVKSNQLNIVGFVSLREEDEKENLQTLMLCKNIGKANTSYLERDNKQREKVGTDRPKIEKRSRSRNSEGQLSRVKEQLAKIIKDRQAQQQKHRQQEVINLVRKEGRQKQRAQMLRYQIQQTQIRQDFHKITKVLKLQRRSTKTEPVQQHSTLPSIHQRIHHHQSIPVSHLYSQERDALQANTAFKVNQVHDQVMSSLEKERDLSLSRQVLTQKIKEQEEEIEQYLRHKKNIVGLLKKQLSGLKETPAVPPFPVIKSKKVIVPRMKILQPKQSSPEASPEPHQPINKSLQSTPQRQNDLSAEKALIRKGRLSRANYRFEQRRQMLKSKLAKGRQDVTAFYDEATRNYQNYHRQSN